MVTTTWATRVNQGSKSAAITLTRSDTGIETVFKSKGVCYSPCPLNASNASAPNIGDWYWDAFGNIRNWSDLWRRDLKEMRHAIGANTIRVYSMLSRQLGSDGSIPNPWNSGQYFAHQQFLDWCWNGDAPRTDQFPLYVLVGIPLPDKMFWWNLYQKTSPAELTYWSNVLVETAKSVAAHPAVMGFIIQNELDGADVCYNDPTLAAFWWGQVERLAGAVKQVAPGKLVGMAVHDDPNIPAKASAYMAQCPHMDFWGVNTYQTQNLDSIFNGVPSLGPGYGGLSGSALKPVILTEFGMPATSHRSASDPSTIYEDPTTRAAAAKVVANIVPQAYRYPVGTGAYYFEFCDEWWNQPGSPNIYTWWGGTSAPGFPNGYWDQDGFGAYSIARAAGLPNNAPVWVNNGPNTPDVHTRRAEITTVLKNAFSGVPQD